MRRPRELRSMGARKKEDSSRSSRTPRARSSGKLGGRDLRQPPPVERHTSIVPQAPRNSHQRPALAANPGGPPHQCARNPHRFQVVHPWEQPFGWRPPPGTASDAQASACKEQVKNRCRGHCACALPFLGRRGACGGEVDESQHYAAAVVTPSKSTGGRGCGT
jgi:hypothetical protein